MPDSNNPASSQMSLSLEERTSKAVSHFQRAVTEWAQTDEYKSLSEGGKAWSIFSLKINALKDNNLWNPSLPTDEAVRSRMKALLEEGSKVSAQTIERLKACYRTADVTAECEKATEASKLMPPPPIPSIKAQTEMHKSLDNHSDDLKHLNQAVFGMFSGSLNGTMGSEMSGWMQTVLSRGSTSGPSSSAQGTADLKAREGDGAEDTGKQSYTDGGNTSR